MTSGFLSCLYGSELHEYRLGEAVEFLSCLYGSELSLTRAIFPLAFLSCLYGSEPQRCMCKPLIFQEFGQKAVI